MLHSKLLIIVFSVYRRAKHLDVLVYMCICDCNWSQAVAKSCMKLSESVCLHNAKDAVDTYTTFTLATCVGLVG